MTPEERRVELEAIGAEVRTCTRCRLGASRTNAVPGEGDADTEVVFVGEGPGFNEDQQGRPFVGAAGGFLNELINLVGWRREEVFITNVVKCRPPGNRDPEPDEIAACAPFLARQLEVLDPALVVTLGRFSMQSFLPGARIGQAHGTMRPVDPATGARNAMAYAMYHPAAAFRQQALRDTMKADMCGVPEALQRSRLRRAAGQADATAAVPDREPTPDRVPTPDREPTPEPAQPIAPVPEPTSERELVAVAVASGSPPTSIPVSDASEVLEPESIDPNQMSFFA